MLNTDYKIYTKVLAERLKTVVHEFVSPEQKGFVPDVSIAECSMMLTLIENYILSKRKTPDTARSIPVLRHGEGLRQSVIHLPHGSYTGTRFRTELPEGRRHAVRPEGSTQT